jgi:hypothetical protein
MALPASSGCTETLARANHQSPIQLQIVSEGLDAWDPVIASTVLEQRNGVMKKFSPQLHEVSLTVTSKCDTR